MSKKAQYNRKRCWAASERKMGEEKEKEESGQRKLKLGATYRDCISEEDSGSEKNIIALKE